MAPAVKRTSAPPDVVGCPPPRKTEERRFAACCLLLYLPCPMKVLLQVVNPPQIICPGVYYFGDIRGQRGYIICAIFSNRPAQKAHYIIFAFLHIFETVLPKFLVPVIFAKMCLSGFSKGGVYYLGSRSPGPGGVYNLGVILFWGSTIWGCLT